MSFGYRKKLTSPSCRITIRVGVTVSDVGELFVLKLDELAEPPGLGSRGFVVLFTTTAASIPGG